MKRLPLAASFVLFVALCASVAYWGLALYKPPLRPVAAPPAAGPQDVDLSAAAGLFGGRGAVAVASNYQLKGVIVADDPAGSVAILAADGKPARAYPVGAEISPGATVKEVHPRFVLVAESGVVKRVELPEDAKSQSATGNASTAPVGASAQPMPMQPGQPQQGMVPPEQSAGEDVNPSMQGSGETVNPSMPPPQVVEPMPSGSQSVPPPETQEGGAPGQQDLPPGMQGQQPPGFPQQGGQQTQQTQQTQQPQQAQPAQQVPPGQRQVSGAR
ncbi:MAG: type II secretion system protein N [Burkholderiaceae bacterium]